MSKFSAKKKNWGPRMLSDQDFIRKEASKNGDPADHLPWAQEGSIFFDWIPIVHQMTIREMIDFMKLTLHDADHPERNETFQDDEYWLRRMTPLRLMYDVREVMFQPSPSIGGNNFCQATETSVINDPESSA